MIELLNPNNNPVYILNKDIYYSTEHKIMQNVPSLLKCYTAKINNKTELIYVTSGLQPLKVVAPQMAAEEFLSAVKKICEAVKDVSNNEFLNLLHLNIEGTFIGKNNIALTYLPITADSTFNNCTEQSIIEYIISCSEYLPSTERLHQLQASPKDSIENFTKALDIKIESKKVLILHDENHNHTITINKPVFKIGKKASSVDGAITYSNNVSRFHCKIENQNDKYYIEDMDSTNGTYINGKPITGKSLLRPGDTLRLADISFEVKEL